PVTGLISSIKSNRLGMDPKTLFPPRNDANVGVTGQGAGRVHVPNALLASTAGVVAYTPVSRNADGTLKTSAYQPSWGLNDIGPGEGASQAFVLRGGPNMVDDSASVALSVLPEGEALGVHAAPMDWFTFSGGASASRGSDGGSFTASVSVPANAAPGQYAATILALADLGGGVTQRIRIPVQFFVPTPVGHDLTGPIWASDVTDYSIVGYENPLGQIYTDWSMVPVRVPMGGANTLTFTVWDEAGGSTMDVFVFDATGNEVNSTVGTDAHMVPGGVALTPTSKDSPGTTSVAVVANDATLNFGEVHAGDVLWLVLSNTKPTHPTTFEMYHLSVAAS
ncbi:MAG: hypothetical protein QOC92_1508, partial [Acidimicrobiaceae bacterium]